MEALELAELIPKGESTTVQFKKRLPHQDSVAQEMIAFSNTKGGLLIIGVDDKGALYGLSLAEIQSTNQQLVNMASQDVFPTLQFTTETVAVNGHNLIVVGIEEGLSKPYKDRLGTIYMKNGSDKRRVTSNDEIARLLQSGKAMYADEIPVAGSSMDDIDLDDYKAFYQRKFKKEFDKEKITVQQSMQNQRLFKDNSLTLAGLLMFCKNRNSFRPQFSILCIAVDATNLLGNSYDDSEPAFEGNLKDVYEQAMHFIDRNMKKIPSGESFNSQPKWQIPREVFEETLVNALIHRDYFIQTTIKVFMFSDRIEIISPGKLPNTQTIENIVNGVSVARNPVLQSLAQYILPYKGAGTGLMRAVSFYPGIKFINDQENERFTVIIKRPLPKG